MFDLENQSHYEVLELPMNASFQEVQRAYLRAKKIFEDENLAIYSLFSEQESMAWIDRIEEAFRVLSSPEMRTQYDRGGETLAAL